MPRARPKMSENGEQPPQTHRSGSQATKLRCDDHRVARKGTGPAYSDYLRPPSAAKSTDRRRFDGGKRRGNLHQSGSIHQRQKGPQPLREKGKVRDTEEEEENWGWDQLSAGGGRKGGGPVSLNHLLNFTFAPRDVTRDHGYRRQSWQRHVGSGMFNKEQFLQANCQFIVQEEGDYTVHAIDTDILVDWGLIEQVRMFCHEISSCPICLYPPRAAKITRCGHIFCWPCILHYLSLSDRDWRKCPICHEAIQKKDLKSVKSLSNHHFAIGDTITMQLMARKRHSGMVTPIMQTLEPQNGQPFNLADPVAKQFEKLLCVSSTQTLQEIIFDEEAELNSLKREMESENEDPVFVVEALGLLDERRKMMIVSQKIASSDEKEKEEKEEKGWKWASGGKFEDVGEFEAAFSDHEEKENSTGEDGTEMASSVAPIDEEPSSRSRSDENEKKATPSADEHIYYFYQASDGQHLYIHPINTKCLAREYGGLTECPHTVTGKIIEIERITQTEEARKRYRFLRHLPLTCQFALCELELKPPTVSKATLQFFHEELQKRRQKRARKAREERKREKEFASKQQGAYQPPPLPSEFDTGPDFQAIQTSEAVLIPGKSRRDCEDAQNDPDLTSPPSFAQALCEGMEKTSPPSVWPIKARQPYLCKSGTPTSSNLSIAGDDEPGSDFVAPSFQDSFTEALTLAMESVTVETSRQLSPSKRTKKGKSKHLLFSTGSQRRY